MGRAPTVLCSVVNANGFVVVCDDVGDNGDDGCGVSWVTPHGYGAALCYPSSVACLLCVCGCSYRASMCGVHGNVVPVSIVVVRCVRLSVTGGAIAVVRILRMGVR